MQRALVAAVLIGAICALVGVYVVLRGLSFIGSGIAHASFGGVALGYLLGFNLVLTALGFCLLTAFGIGWVTKRGQVREDAAIGVFFASTMALGILIIGLLRGYNVDLFGYLFGSILAVGTTDLWSTVGLALLVIIIVGVFFKELLIITFDPVTARAMGLPVDLLYFLLLGLLAVTVVISIKVVGIVLVSALIVTPAAAAYQWVDDFLPMIGLSVLIGVLSAVAGLFLSYYLNTASGATIVLTSTLVFFVSMLASPKRRRSVAV
jgi:ABC-type Mn2+/Zn2+ transport system permease subunit